MSIKPVVLRETARRDVDEAVAYYLAKAGMPVALDFIDALAKVCAAMGDQPGTGFPRYAHELGIPGLRFRTVGKFPYLVFYVESEAEIDVWRVLHGTRDIPSWLQDVREG